jgi:hypothetical protein
MPAYANAELRDPTKPAYSILTESTESQYDDELILSAIWMTAKNRRATINGVTARQGQTILNGVKIISIRHNSVILKQNGTIKTLHLLQRPYKTK